MILSLLLLSLFLLLLFLSFYLYSFILTLLLYKILIGLVWSFDLIKSCYLFILSLVSLECQLFY